LSSSPPTNPFDNHRTYCIWGFGKEFTMIQSRYIFSRLVCVVHANDRSAPVQRGFYDFPIDSHGRSSRLREELKKYCTRTDRAESEQNSSLLVGRILLKESNPHNPGVAARSFRRLREDRRPAGGRRQAREWTRSKQHSPSRDDPKALSPAVGVMRAERQQVPLPARIR
jgi:hypothetical protein